MKKIMIIEIAVLAALVITALAVCIHLTQPALAPMEDTQNTTEQTETTEILTETTEPQPTWLTHPASRQLLAQQYFVYDCQSEQFVTISGDAGERIYPASITKLLTAYVAMQYLQPEQLIAPGTALEYVVWGSSVAKIEETDVLSAERLVEAMLLPSGNDAAYILAAAAGRVMLEQPEADTLYAVQTFMDRMNQQAQQLGMTGSHFVNPDGIHSDEHYMSFADLAILGKLALENETILKYANLPRDEIQLTAGPTQWKNTNMLINPATKYYCPYAIGLKTGQTPSAGSCLLSAFDYEGRKLVIGVFGCPEIEDRFDDTLQLFNQTIGIE